MNNKAFTTYQGAAIPKRLPPCPGPELSIVIPTFKEHENIPEVVKRLDECLRGIHWEAIFVDDDSPDDTAGAVTNLARLDHRVRLVHRIGRRGLSTACMEGMLASCAPYLAVMDADLQHDERLLPDMLSAVKENCLDVVIGSRYMEGGSTGSWNTNRENISRLATKLSKLVLRADIKDPMSGFFLIRREVLQDAVRNLSGIGFKILLDIFASAPRSLTFKEIPYNFRPRQAGESKLDSVVVWEYLMMLLDKALGHYVPVRLISFAFVGMLGVVGHVVALWLCFRVMGLTFLTSQALATLVAISANFFMNNILTYRDRRLSGFRFVRGWLSFLFACLVGAVANVSVATFLYEASHLGWIPSALAGLVIGGVWNYAVTAMYTWSKPKPSATRRGAKHGI